MPAHHRAEEALEAYLAAGGLEHPKAALFQSVDRARRTVLAMVVPLAGAARSLNSHAGSARQRSPATWHRCSLSPHRTLTG